jgi:metal-responsive CopG/Arc/MetJ family transcriptional regulator
MAKIKIAVSLDASMVKRIDRFALATKLSRSQVASQALEEFLQRYENRALLDAINSACDAISEPPDTAQRQAMRTRQHRLAG